MSKRTTAAATDLGMGGGAKKRVSKEEKQRLKAEAERLAELDRDPRWLPKADDVVECPGRWTVKVRSSSGSTVYGQSEPDTDPMPFSVSLKKWRELYHRPEAFVRVKAGDPLTKATQPKFTPAPPARPRAQRPPRFGVLGNRRVGTRLR